MILTIIGIILFGVLVFLGLLIWLIRLDIRDELADSRFARKIEKMK